MWQILMVLHKIRSQKEAKNNFFNFWLWGPGKPGRRYFFKKFNLFRQFYAQTSIFSIKVCFLPNADILDYGNDRKIWILIKEKILFLIETKEDTGNGLCEELLIDAIVTINNLSFYNSELMFNYSKKIIDCK
jgi:hypothetical protein